MKKINVDDIVLIDDNNVLKKVLVTRVNRTTFQCLDEDKNFIVYFIKEIKKIYAKQKYIDFEFKSNEDNQIQLSLF